MEEYKYKFQKTFVNISSRKSQLLFQTKKKCPFQQNCTHKCLGMDIQRSLVSEHLNNVNVYICMC